MSFAKNLKTELSQIQNSDCCAIACGYGLLLFGRAFSASEISLLTEHNGVASLYCDAVALLSGQVADLQETPGGYYQITVRNAEQRMKILNTLGLDARNPRKQINLANLQNECCFGAFLRGAFLACGTVTDPNKDYHLEFSVPSVTLCEQFTRLFDEFDLTPRRTQRNSIPVLYFKSSEEIEDTIGHMGGNESYMEFIGTKVIKDIRNRVNRKCNFENANAKRAVISATAQRDAILHIRDTVGIESIPKELRELAQVRLDNPELSTTALLPLLSESLTKSGLHHRMKRIEQFAADLKTKTEKNQE
ncbi:MAG: DNA-binding protein WhiA [Clostridia bacterium]|nr:DNA-binding protein WhiA [Clostridia bacterium]